MKSSVSREVSVKVVSQVVHVLLFAKRSFNNGRRGTGEINPAKIASHCVQVREHLAGTDTGVHSLLE